LRALAASAGLADTAKKPEAAAKLP
jgi:hypothetical protein